MGQGLLRQLARVVVVERERELVQEVPGEQAGLWGLLA